MGGTTLDVIHSVPRSRIQGFTVCYDDSCARLNASLKSRVERGHQVRGETKRSSTGTLCKVRRPGGGNWGLAELASRGPYGASLQVAPT